MVYAHVSSQEGRDFMHLIFVLARHKQRFFWLSFVSVNGDYILAMMKHLAMQQDVSHKKGRLFLWQLFMSVSGFMLM